MKVFMCDKKFAGAVIVAENAEKALAFLREYEGKDECLVFTLKVEDLKEVALLPGVIFYYAN